MVMTLSYFLGGSQSTQAPIGRVTAWLLLPSQGGITAPKPPESRQLISPKAAVFEIAPAKVLQGAVRLQGLASSPTPDTQVRLACALAERFPIDLISVDSALVYRGLDIGSAKPDATTLANASGNSLTTRSLPPA